LRIVTRDTPLTQTPTPLPGSAYNAAVDPTQFAAALQNGGFEATIEVAPSP